jgi:dihydrofolate synthase/folylpolyglutamate synthase
MTYQQTIDYLYSRLPVFHQIGARAFKPGLQITLALCADLNNPQLTYPCIHIGGTNGKGSSSHMIAAILQQAGYKVGLYTSPHLKSFTERIKVNGIPVSEDFVVQFADDIKSNIDRLEPSFFELTVAMAFSYFQSCAVDVAVIEVGMGGRLDSTNIIDPVLSLITNVSYDHTQFLGETLPLIAAEKAGIIKKSTPVVISEVPESDVAEVFNAKALALDSPISFGEALYHVTSQGMRGDRLSLSIKDLTRNAIRFSDLQIDLAGSYQCKNLGGVLASIDVLRTRGFSINENAVVAGLGRVVEITGLKGRWQKLNEQPVVYCDTAHNHAGLSETIAQFKALKADRRRFVLGFVGDKDVRGIMDLLPTDAEYYFCQPSNMRALNVSELARIALQYGLRGKCFQNVNEALKSALNESTEADAIYVGGSTFVVADLDQL